MPSKKSPIYLKYARCRFKTATLMVLLATDVAARGLDVPAVEHVVHYQLPRTADTYIHRSGRTARAGAQGLSLQLCAPEEKATQKALMKSLGRSTFLLSQYIFVICDSAELTSFGLPGANMQELQVEFSLLTKLRERVELARQIEVAHHRADKAAHEESWLQQAAKDMELDLDNDEDHDSHDGRGASKKRSRAAKAQERDLCARLKAMLGQPLMLRGISAKYLTSGGSATFATQMLSGSNHKVMFGLTQTKAIDDNP